MFVREMAYDPDMYGPVGSFGDPASVDSSDPEALRFWKTERLERNPNYYPGLYADIWPILFRPNEFNFLTLILQASNYPHSQETRGAINPTDLSKPPGTVKDKEADLTDAKVKKTGGASRALFSVPRQRILRGERETQKRSVQTDANVPV